MSEPPPAAPETKADAFLPAIKDACRRIATKESKAIAASFARRCRENSTDGFTTWFDRFCEEQRAFVVQALWPILSTAESVTGRTAVPGVEVIATSYILWLRNEVTSILARAPQDLPGWAQLRQAVDGSELTDLVLEAIQGSDQKVASHDE